jgi:O-antigen biosynthesis protein WbqP
VLQRPQLTNVKISNNILQKTGYHLRKYSIDKCPQLFNVISGYMPLVGPRPALYNQYDLRQMRTK